MDTYLASMATRVGMSCDQVEATVACHRRAVVFDIATYFSAFVPGARLVTFTRDHLGQPWSILAVLGDGGTIIDMPAHVESGFNATFAPAFEFFEPVCGVAVVSIADKTWRLVTNDCPADSAAGGAAEGKAATGGPGKLMSKTGVRAPVLLARN